MTDLAQKKCEPCEGTEDPMTREEAEDFLEKLDPDWDLMNHEKIACEFQFEDFQHALDFVNDVGEIAEEEGHHPDILLHDYKNVRVELSTHAIEGLSKNDFILAAKIDKLIGQD